ncbi:MAG: DUF2157 domain-containing protein [Saprospiraceae bacterium]|nr:DUF2157 domain-containing protein [Saprospiraceae bacterium]
MQKEILDDLDDLLTEHIIDQKTADAITDFYQRKAGKQKSRQYIVFGILGSLLIGLGIILIVAHNWDDLNRTSKTILGFIPLVLGQALGIFTLLRWSNNTVWRESAATLWVLGLGATLSLISQIYHIQGSLASYMLTWMILILPIIYLLPSTMAAVLYILGITFYGADIGYGGEAIMQKVYYWLLLIPLLPYYIFQVRNHSKSNFTYLLNWLIPLSVIINLGTVAHQQPEWLFVSYMALFGIYYLIGKHVRPFKGHLQNNGYRSLGSLGIIILLTTLSFHWLWKELAREELNFNNVEALITFLFCGTLAFFIYKFHQRGKYWFDTDPNPYIPLIFLILFIFFRSSTVISVIIINLLLFILALYTIKRAIQLQHLGLLNYGLVIITALIICRFFDTNISFVLRGLLFVLIGIGFFVANYRMIKRPVHDT